MKNKTGFLIIVVQSVIILLLLIYLVLSLDGQDRIAITQEEAAEIKEREEWARHRNDSLSLLLQEIRILNAIPPFLDSRQVDDLVKMGLDNPVQDLRNDLVSGPGLINTSAVLGGSMGFYFPDGIHILNKKWVFAYFEDGHIAGAMLLKYDIAEGRIEWEVLDEYIY